MSKTARVEMEFDERTFAALELEAARLGLTVQQVVDRATVAWLQESADNTALFGARIAQPARLNA